MWIEFRTLGRHRGIDISQLIARLAEERHRLAEQYLAIYILVFTRRIGEMVPDVAHIGRPQQGITYRMNQHIRVAMPQ